MKLGRMSGFVGLLFDNLDEERETQAAEFRRPRETKVSQANGTLADLCVSAITKSLAERSNLRGVQSKAASTTYSPLLPMQRAR